jgi:carbon storage regulator
VIGSDVTLTILGVQSNHIRIGVDAPRDIGIHREEIFRRIQFERITDRKQQV